MTSKHSVNSLNPTVMERSVEILRRHQFLEWEKQPLILWKELPKFLVRYKAL